jgi:hypothetical protein
MSSKKFMLTLLDDEAQRPLFRSPDKANDICQICQAQMIVVSDYSEFMCPECGKVLSLNRGGGGDHPDRAA